LPTKWRRFSGFYPQDGGVGFSPIRRRRFWEFYQQDGSVGDLPTRWRQCRVSESFTHKMAAWEFCLQDGGVSESFTHKMAATATASIRVIVVLGQYLVAVI